MNGMSGAGKDYSAVFSDISKLYEDTLGMPLSERNRALVSTYWHIGRRIVEVNQGGSGSAKYGAQILKRLSADLTAKYGDGFSLRSLFNIRRFSLEYAEKALVEPLPWSHYRTLLGVADLDARAALEARIRKEGLSSREIERFVRRANGLAFAAKVNTDDALLVPRKGRPHLYRLEKVREGGKTVAYLDAGFSVKHRVPSKGLSRLARHAIVTVNGKTIERVKVDDESERFCYEGVVMRVVDGDTLQFRADLGWNVVADLRLRLRGVDAAELGTGEGEKAKRFVEKLMTPGRKVRLFTYGCDVYGRYLADVFYGDNGADLTPGKPGVIFLNEQIISTGHAGFMKANIWKEE